ncbi:MAG: hypothetical protein JXR64_10790 [Spirochaetales bacterium]|nr:hypothetical protein [Spirochaetales bacterium]
MVKRLFLFLCIGSIPLFAEVNLDASISAILAANRVDNEDFTTSGMAKGNLNIKSEGDSNVKSQLTLDFIYMRNVGSLSISKAWIKFRFPILRVTIGKNRITWGEGVAFNAGDVIFDDYSLSGGEGEEVDLTASELKSLNRTMGLVTFPLGRYTFTELIYLPYDFLLDGDLSSLSKGLAPQELEIYKHSGGGRFVTQVGGVKLETGYIYNGFTSMHKPYVSFNGSLGLDYQLSASVKIDQDNIDGDDIAESLKISGGIIYLFDLENDKSLTLRLETQWERDNLQFYPEIAFVPTETISLFGRSIIEVDNESAKTTVGLNWKTYQGFVIGSYITYNKDINVSVIITHSF